MNLRKKVLSAVTALAIGASATVGLFSSAETSTASAADTMTAVEITEDMGMGWNLGNAMDSTNTWTSNMDGDDIQTAWGNDAVDQTDFENIVAAGFTTLRIPVTWYCMYETSGTASMSGFLSAAASDDTPIDEDYLDYLKDLIDMAYNAGFEYVIINTHHDEDWESDTDNLYIFENLWAQVAEYFGDYGQELIFEGMNEVSFSSNDDAEEYNQAFVKAVRNAEGDGNADRLLIVTSVSNNTDNAIDDLTMPEDDGPLAVSVHYYEPTTFCVGSANDGWSGDDTTWGTTTEQKNVDADFEDLYNKFIANGYGVVLGELGVCNADHFDEDQSTDYGKELDSIQTYYEYVMSAALNYEGMCPIVWDDSDSGTIYLYSRVRNEWWTIDDDIDGCTSETYDLASLFVELAQASGNEDASTETTKSTMCVTDLEVDIATNADAENLDNGTASEDVEYLTIIAQVGETGWNNYCALTIYVWDSENGTTSYTVYADETGDTSGDWVSIDEGDYITFTVELDDIISAGSTYQITAATYSWEEGDTPLTIYELHYNCDGDCSSASSDSEDEEEDDTTTTTTTEEEEDDTTTTTTTAAAEEDDEDATVYGNAYFIGSFGTESNWDAGDNDGVSVIEVTGDGTYTVEWDVASATETGSSWFLVILIEPNTDILENFTTDTVETLAVTLDAVTVDGDDITFDPDDYVANVAYYESSVGVTRIYLHDDWSGVDCDVLDDMTISESITATFTISGLEEEEEEDDTTTTTTTTEEEDDTTTTTTTTTTVEEEETTTTTEEENGEDVDTSSVTLYGDINLDGKVNLADSVLLAQHLAGTADLDDSQLANADVNASGSVTSTDASLLMQFQVALIDTLPTT